MNVRLDTLESTVKVCLTHANRRLVSMVNVCRVLLTSVVAVPALLSRHPVRFCVLVLERSMWEHSVMNTYHCATHRHARTAGVAWRHHQHFYRDLILRHHWCCRAHVLLDSRAPTVKVCLTHAYRRRVAFLALALAGLFTAL